jgi:UDP-glucose 4-epimerase
MGEIKRVLVTGATGYIGARICTHLKDCGFQVFALCRSIPKNIEEKFSGIEILRGDITEKETIEYLFTIPFDAVIHTVSLDHTQTESFEINQVNEINVNPTWVLMDGFLKTNLKTFIYLSTIHVIGNLPLTLFDESYSNVPNNKYGLTHLMGEKLCEYYANKSKKNYLSLRLSNGYGSPVFNENKWDGLVVNDLVKTAFYEKKIILKSDGTAFRDFIHIKDITRAIEDVFKKGTYLKNCYYLASGSTISLLQLAHLVKKIYLLRYGVDIKVYHSENQLSEQYNQSENTSVVNNSNLIANGFKLEMTLVDGIAEIFEYLESI